LLELAAFLELRKIFALLLNDRIGRIRAALALASPEAFLSDKMGEVAERSEVVRGMTREVARGEEPCCEAVGRTAQLLGFGRR
jgi:hypothetical protein